jgi:hypothetical protein
MSAAMVLLVAVSCIAFVEFDRDGWNGAAVGAALGLLNLGVGYVVTRHSLRKGMKSAMTTLLSGLTVRVFVLAGLTIAFHYTGSIDAVAFALIFMLFFFIYVAFEIYLVERRLQSAGGAA